MFWFQALLVPGLDCWRTSIRQQLNSRMTQQPVSQQRPRRASASRASASRSLRRCGSRAADSRAASRRNQEAFLADLKKQPIGASAKSGPYNLSPVLQSNNANHAWSTVLSELLALRYADGSSSYYYGVARVNYGSGVAGMGYLGGTARTAVGWDYLPSGAHVMAHELGHNLGRNHAPCGASSETDQFYPYAGGKTGTWGMDVAAMALKAPTLSDLMSYCGPSWISDYNWTAMLSYRQSGPNNAPAAAAGDGLLFWGRILPTGVVLEPAFRVSAGSEPGPRPGANRLELLDRRLLLRSGSKLLPGRSSRCAEQHFAFVLPLDRAGDGFCGFGSFRGRNPIAAPAFSSRRRPGRLVSRPLRDKSSSAGTPPVSMVLVRTRAWASTFVRPRRSNRLPATGGFELSFSDGVRTLTRPGRLLR
jgi:hypothetical protein